MYSFYKDVVKGRALVRGYPWFFFNCPDPEGTDRLTNLDHYKTMVAKAVIQDGSVKRVSFLPAIINPDHVPLVLTRKDPRAQEILDYIQKISRSQYLKVTLNWDGNEVLISEN